MEIITEAIDLARLRELAVRRFGEMVKAVEEDWIEFDSMINLRPSQGNRSRGVDDPETRQRIAEVVSRLVTR